MNIYTDTRAGVGVDLNFGHEILIKNTKVSLSQQQDHDWCVLLSRKHLLRERKRLYVNC